MSQAYLMRQSMVLSQWLSVILSQWQSVILSQWLSVILRGGRGQQASRGQLCQQCRPHAYQ